MNKLSKFVCFILIGVSVLLAGCPKTPKRPDPGQTTAGMGPGGINSEHLNFDSDLASMGLQQRTPGSPYTEADIERGVLPTIYFDFDRSGIKASERVKLEQAAKWCTENAGRQLILEGHCDWRGTAEYNLGLGDRRSNAVKEYLANLGVQVIRLEVVSKGDLDARENGTSEEMSKDRRVEILLLKQ